MTGLTPAESREWRAAYGATLHDLVFGEPGAPPERTLVVVCGAFLPAAIYAPFATSLARELGGGWAIHVYDRRGKGGSSPVDESYLFDTELDDVRTALSESGARHVLGHSLGGAIVLHAVRAPSWMVAGVMAVCVRTGLRGMSESLFPAGAAELRAAFAEEARAADFAHMPSNVCILVGEKSADYFRATAAALGRAMPDATLVEVRKGIHGSVPAVRHPIVPAAALWLRGEQLGDVAR